MVNPIPGDEVGNDDAVEELIPSDIPQIYCNGFTCGLTYGDVIAVLQTNGRSVAALNMSFTVAKTLSASLGQLIGALENDTDHEIMTLADIKNAEKAGSNKR